MGLLAAAFLSSTTVILPTVNNIGSYSTGPTSSLGVHRVRSTGYLKGFPVGIAEREMQMGVYTFLGAVQAGIADVADVFLRSDVIALVHMHLREVGVVGGCGVPVSDDQIVAVATKCGGGAPMNNITRTSRQHIIATVQVLT